MKVREYLATTLDGMAKGLFASLLIGVMIEQIGAILGIDFIRNIGTIAKYFMGPCIGAGVAYSRNGGPFTLFSSAVVGAIGAGTVSFATGAAAFATGEPLGAYFAAALAVEVGRRIEGKTKFDILIVPGIVILLGGLFGYFVSPGISFLMKNLGVIINEFTKFMPAPMGIILGAVIGIILTLPISSAALCISMQISGIAAGAALAGCCAQMVGFAVSSFRENKVPGLISQGLGTSMLQVPNIIRNPLIWIPPTVAGAVSGLLSTTVFKISSDAVGAGMGTCGLIGPLRTYDVMGSSSLIPMLICFIVVPAVISLLLSEIMRKLGMIEKGDMSLS